MEEVAEDRGHADKVIARIFDLPEVAAFGAAVERTTGGAANLSAHVESFPPPGCRAGAPECSYRVYVGEHHPDHMARWYTFVVDPRTMDIAIESPADDSTMSYEQWRRRIRAVYKDFPEFRKLPILFPLHHPGDGDFGYGSPDEVITDILAWSHPLKAACADLAMNIVRVELYQKKTFPVLIVLPLKVPLGGREPRAAGTLARSLLAANAGWPYEIVVQSPSGWSERARYREGLATFSFLQPSGWTSGR